MAARQESVDLVRSIVPNEEGQDHGDWPIISTPVRSVFINGIKPAVLGSACADGSVIVTASNNVFYENNRAARLADKTALGYVETSSPNVFVNNR